MGNYVIGGRSTGGSGAVAQPCMAQLWNPSSTVPLFVSRILVVVSAANPTSADYAVFRSSTRGTAATTITADIDNDIEQALAPPSDALLDLASFTTNNPTYSGSSLSAEFCRPLAGSGLFLVLDDNIKVRPGTGLCVIRVAQLSGGATDFTYWWTEH